MDKRVTLILIIVMNACAGAGTFELVHAGSTASKAVAFAAWLCSNILAVLGQPMVAPQVKIEPVTAPEGASDR